MSRKPSYKELEKKVRLLQKQLQDHRNACQEQVKEERLRGVLEMAGAVCHELSQPMQVLSVYCERFLKETPQENPAYEEVENIMDKIDRIASITRKLQTIASYETKDYIEGKKIIDIEKASQAA
jgi:C4-dicarboxylate-specific signal transduction histidine kinase